MLEGLMKQFEETQKKMTEELSKEVIECSDAEGNIKVKVDGNNKLLDLNIDMQILSSENKEMIEDILIETLNKATQLATEKQKQVSQNSVGNILPGGMNLGNLFG